MEQPFTGVSKGEPKVYFGERGGRHVLRGRVPHVLSGPPGAAQLEHRVNVARDASHGQPSSPWRSQRAYLPPLSDALHLPGLRGLGAAGRITTCAKALGSPGGPLDRIQLVGETLGPLCPGVPGRNERVARLPLSRHSRAHLATRSIG